MGHGNFKKTGDGNFKGQSRTPHVKPTSGAPTVNTTDGEDDDNINSGGNINGRGESELLEIEHYVDGAFVGILLKIVA